MAFPLLLVLLVWEQQEEGEEEEEMGSWAGGDEHHLLASFWLRVSKVSVLAVSKMLPSPVPPGRLTGG